MKHLPLFTVLMFTLLYTSAAQAYGHTAHNLIARLAEERLSDKARAAIGSILPGSALPEIAWWADEMRSRNRGSPFWGYRHSANWHFVNIPPDEHYDRSKAAPEGDIVMAIEDFSAILGGGQAMHQPIRAALGQYAKEFPDAPDPFSDRALALRLLVHYLADIHQPLHVGYGADSGGNRIGVSWYGRDTNLHAVWDTQLVRSLSPSVDALYRSLDAALSVASEEQTSHVANTGVDDWLEEGLRLRVIVYDSAEPGSYLAAGYAASYADTARSQLLKAAIRTATVLNRIFDGQPASPPTF